MISHAKTPKEIKTVKQIRTHLNLILFLTERCRPSRRAGTCTGADTGTCTGTGTGAGKAHWSGVSSLHSSSLSVVGI